MGFAYVPFTFPTAGVAGRMAQAGVTVGFGVVDSLYDAYYLALQDEGLKAYAYAPGAANKNNTALLNSLAKRTGQPKGVVSAWLNALYAEVADNGRNYYLDPVTADAAAAGQFDPINHPLSTLEVVTKSVGQAAANTLKPSADALTNVIKYTALAVAAGALVYGMYTGMKIYKARKRGKRG